MLTFSTPRTVAERLARIALACSDDRTAISHIGIRVASTAVRFAATNGRILASVVVPVDHLGGEPADVVLDREQFVAAMKIAAKGSGQRIAVEIGPKEARVSNGTTSAIVRRVDGTFPNVEHVWTRPDGRRWVATMSSLDTQLTGIAQKISGNKQPLLFVSPVDPTSRLERLWAMPGVDDHAEVIHLTALRPAVTAPAYWCDHELAILVMPITRMAEERQLDLAAHALPLLALVAQAA